MKENIYDDSKFFELYGQMERSKKGLEASGEWHELKSLLADFKGKRILDLGCGYGWHAKYACDNGAKSVCAVDISNKMIARAKELNSSEKIEYITSAIEDVDFEVSSFDIIISSLALHYILDYEKLIKKINKWLIAGGTFIFSWNIQYLHQQEIKIENMMKVEKLNIFQ